MPTRAGRGTDARCRLCPSAGRRPRVSGAFCTFRKPEGRRGPVRFRLPQFGKAAWFSRLIFLENQHSRDRGNMVYF